MSETSAGMYLHDCTELLSDREHLTVTSGALRSRGVRGRSGVCEYAAYLRLCCRALDGCREMNKCRGAASGDRTLGITSFYSMSIALHPSLHRHPDDYTSTYTDSPLALLPITTHIHITMSAPNYQASNDDTIAPHKSGFSSGNAYGSGSTSGNEEDLHRYVTDDEPRKAKMGIADGAGAPPRQQKPKPTDGLIVSSSPRTA
jgi:hypothetical protein